MSPLLSVLISLQYFFLWLSLPQFPDCNSLRHLIFLSLLWSSFFSASPPLIHPRISDRRWFSLFFWYQKKRKESHSLFFLSLIPFHIFSARILFTLSVIESEVEWELQRERERERQDGVWVSLCMSNSKEGMDAGSSDGRCSCVSRIEPQTPSSFIHFLQRIDLSVKLFSSLSVSLSLSFFF